MTSASTAIDATVPGCFMLSDQLLRACDFAA